MEIKTRNVNTAFETIVAGMQNGDIETVREDSRNGPVIRITTPLLLTYTQPKECVLFHPGRNANPFFHLFEAVWMLAGSKLVEPVAYYVKQMLEYSNDGTYLDGAYGFRWRKHFVHDQLDNIINNLSKDPTCRRQVLGMWDPSVDWDLGSKDLPCNTHAYFRITNRSSYCYGPADTDLDMTVCNRSNDIIWGMLGANAVHFVFLQWYIADCLGVNVGHYHQFTNNAHIYKSKWTPEKWEPCKVPQGLDTAKKLVEDKERFDNEVAMMAGRYGDMETIDGLITEPFLRYTVMPACIAYRRYKQGIYSGDRGGFLWADRIGALDWRRACLDWLNRRYIKQREK
jgi:thymidylate synthase